MSSSPTKPVDQSLNVERMDSGTPHVLGATARDKGVNFAVFSEHATRVELCLFSHDGLIETARLSLPEKTGSIWHGFLRGLKAGACYGYRVHGPYLPEQGHRFNPNKLLLDPYTRELIGHFSHHDAQFGFNRASIDEDLSFDDSDSAPYVAKSVVPDPAEWQPLELTPNTDLSTEVIYEAHVKGLTQSHPEVPENIRGTYEGLASDAVIAHLKTMGITTIELLPVHAFLDEEFLQNKQLTNYWGYNSIGFMAPEPRYFGPSGIKGFRQMIQRFQDADIRVILDVVYNHTAEGDQRGPTLSFRGLDNASYYRLDANDARFYVNDTGCGNTLNLSHPYVLKMVMDSLRFWVQYVGVNGFRFDLASTLARENHGFDQNGGFLDAIRQDPVLAGVTLIAEPWDIGPGGYQLGAFPPEFLEWNDTYRDSVKRYWRGDAHAAQDLAASLLASAEKFDHSGRPAWSSVNFIASHDGFTLADLTRYKHRHNELNKENNQDGHGANYSDNCGVEGDTQDEIILKKRGRRVRNFLATVFLSQGTPMMLAGDEIGHSQSGNNNAYCQDNELSWLDWPTMDKPLSEFVARLIKFRKNYQALRQKQFLHGAERGLDQLPDVAWTAIDGSPLPWNDPGLSSLCLTLRYSAAATLDQQACSPVFLVFHRDSEDIEVGLPNAGENRRWVKHINTGSPEICEPTALNSPTVVVAGESVIALVSELKI